MNEVEKRNVASSINEVRELFLQSPNIFLTEDDLRFHICKSLSRYFGAEEPTQDGDKSISLHTEVRWYGEGNLRTRSDIVLVDVSNLNVLKYNQLPSKGYGFNIPKAIIELKFRRPNGASNSSFLKSIRKDITKLTELKRVFHTAQGADQTECWLIIFDKMSELQNPIIAPEGITTIYKFNNTANNRLQAIGDKSPQPDP